MSRPFRKGYDPRRGDPSKAGKAGGRPPIWWTEALAQKEPAALDTLTEAMGTTKKGRLRYPSMAVRAAEIVLDRLHGKPVQPTQQLPAVDLSKLSEQEKLVLDDLLSRVIARDGESARK